MESKFKQFINDNKGFVVFYLIWFPMHLVFFSLGEGDEKYSGNKFWPFDNWPFGDCGRTFGFFRLPDCEFKNMSIGNDK